MKPTEIRGLGLAGAALIVGLMIGSWQGGAPESAAQFDPTATIGRASDLLGTDTPPPGRPSTLLTPAPTLPGRPSTLLAPDNAELDRIVSTHEARISALETRVARP